MQLFVRAVVTGFGMALGAALFKKISRQLGLDEPDKTAEPPAKPPEPLAAS